MKITNNSKIEFNFAIELEDGQIVDSNLEKAPVSCTLGDGSLLAGFEEALLGASAGDDINVILPPEKAFGQSNPNNVQEFDRSVFADDMTLEIGLMISFKDAGNTELPGVVSIIEEDKVTVDFNHPLASKPLRFIAKIHSVGAA
jgi:FKBP-type peptidyl-prolyl cis-trans isomerase SlpA